MMKGELALHHVRVVVVVAHDLSDISENHGLSNRVNRPRLSERSEKNSHFWPLPQKGRHSPPFWFFQNFSKQRCSQDQSIMAHFGMWMRKRKQQRNNESSCVTTPTYWLQTLHQPRHQIDHPFVHNDERLFMFAMFALFEWLCSPPAQPNSINCITNSTSWTTVQSRKVVTKWNP